MFLLSSDLHSEKCCEAFHYIRITQGESAETKEGKQLVTNTAAVHYCNTKCPDTAMKHMAAYRP